MRPDQSGTLALDSSDGQIEETAPPFRFTPADEEIAPFIPLRKQRLVRMCLASASGVAATAMLIGVAALLGYAIDVRFLWRVIDGAPAIRPVSAAGIFAVGLAILLARPWRTGNASLLLALPVGLIGVLGLAGSRFAWSLRLFARAAETPGAGRMAPDTSITLLLLAAAIVLLRFRNVAAAQNVAAAAAMVPYTAGIAYLYGIPGFSGWMSFPTMLGSFACAAAILLRTAHRDPLRALLSPHRAGRMARLQMMILCGCSLAIGSIAVLASPVLARPALAFESASVGLATLLVIAFSAIAYERVERGRRRADAALLSAATHDHLTGLLNRRGFFSAGREALRRQKQEGADAGILLLDIDHFKTINDSYGQQAGDAFLQQLAAEIAGMAGRADVIGRLGSNEFALILPGAEAAQYRAVAEALRRAVAEMDIGGSRNVNPMTASAGISTAGLGGHQLEVSLGQAGLALFLAKSEGRNRSRLFRLEDALQRAENQELERALSHAVECNEMFVMYQPQVNLVSGRLVGVEALARWRHPTRGLIPPDKFIPRAEACGLIGAINAWVLECACGQMRRWEEAGLGDFIFSVNVSASQLREPGLAGLVLATLGRHGLPPEKLVLEVTESVMMTPAGAGLKELRELAEKGVRIAIDDFGTGYSSLSYLHTLPCNYLKIDRSFVSDIPDNKDAVAIAKGVVAMGRSLGLRLIAEGIETQEQADFMRRLWCEDGQGYLFAAPMIGDDLEQWARSRSQREPDADADEMWEIA